MSVQGFVFESGGDQIKYDYTQLDNLPVADTTLNVEGAFAESKAVKTALAGKVDKVTGKDLSTNDYTTAEKTKLAGIEAGATAVTIDPTPTQGSTNAVSSGGVWDTSDTVTTRFEKNIGADTVLNIGHFTSGYFDIGGVGTIVDITSKSENSRFVSAIVNLAGYEECHVQAHGGGTITAGARAYGILDENGYVIDRCGPNAVYALSDTISVPDNAVYLIVNANIKYDYAAYAGVKLLDKIADNTNTSKRLIDGLYKEQNIIKAEFSSGYIDLPGASGSTVNITNIINDIRFHHTIVDVEEWQYIYVNGVVGAGGTIGGARAYSIIDEDNNVLYTSAKNTTLLDAVITLPVGAKKIIFNTRSMENLYLMSNGVSTETNNALFENEVSEKLIADFSKFNTYNKTIKSNGTWSEERSSYVSCFIPLTIGIEKTITIKGHATNGSIIALLTHGETGLALSQVNTFAKSQPSRIVLTAGQEIIIKVSSDCAYIFVVLVSSQNSYQPQYIKVRQRNLKIHNQSNDTVDDKIGLINENIITGAIALKPNLHDLPQGKGVSNAYKRAMQLINIQWDALSQLPYSGESGNPISAGQKTGVLYSSVKEYDKYIGWNVSIKTFMTAAHNPYSLLYTEDTLGDRSTSEYGITYHGINCGAYFGIVCNILALYAIGFKIPWNTAEFDYLYRIGKLLKPYDQSATGVRLMDLIWEPGHANIIIDIQRNSDGEPVYIWWAEAIHNFPTVHKYTAEEFNNRLATKNGIIYYSSDLYKNLDYTPSEFVAVGGETIAEYEYNDDICTYAGDCACFNSTDDVWINYTAGNYTELELYKNDLLISTVPIDSSLHKIKVSTTGYGKYKARLKNGSNYSDYTYFQIVDTTVTANYSNGILSVEFSSANGTPVYAQLTYRNGTSMGIIDLTEDEIAVGKCLFNPAKVLNDQYKGKAFTETTYIKVFFRGDYGVVPNAYLDTGIIS